MHRENIFFTYRVLRVLNFLNRGKTSPKIFKISQNGMHIYHSNIYKIFLRKERFFQHVVSQKRCLQIFQIYWHVSILKSDNS